MRVKPSTNPSGSAEGVASALGPLLPAFELARVEPGTYGPVSASLDGGTIAVWASPTAKNERIWYSRSLDRDGHATTASRIIGKTSLELGLVTLAPVTQGLRTLLLYSTQSAQQTTKLYGLLLDSTGSAKAPIVELVTLGSSLLWTQVVDTERGPLVLYAVARDDRADVRALALTHEGTLRSADREVATGLRAWQVISAPDGAALATVGATRQGQGDTVSLLLLDKNGALTKEPIAVDASGTAELDLDLTRVGNNYILAWSNRRRIDSRVQVAALDPVGNIVAAPRPAVDAIGEQTLIQLVPPARGGHAVLVWENPTLPFSHRRLSLAEIDSNAQLGNRVVHLACSSRSSTLPELIATQDGLRALTFDDIAGARGGDADPDSIPTYVEFGPGLLPRAAVPLTLQSGIKDEQTIPLMAWGLDCRHGCRVTAALKDSPVTIATIPLGDAMRRPHAIERARELVQVDTPTSPRLLGLDSIVELEPLSDLTGLRKAEGFLLGSITYFDPTTPLKRLATPGPDGRTDPLQARVDVFDVGANGEVSGSNTISYRASSLPGLSLAAAKSGGSGLAWSAMDQGQPQLFVTALREDAKKQSQRMLTHKKGRLDEVTMAPVDNGWLLAWFDERSGDAELYATRVNQSLERRGAEERLTQRPGELSSLALVPMGEEAIVIYVASRRGNSQRGVELYTRRIALSDARPRDVEHRIAELSGAVKFLTASRFENGIVLGWLEIPTDGGISEDSAHLRLLRLDARGEATSQMTSLVEADGVPASVAIECLEKQCHGILVADVGGRGELQGFAFDPKSTSAPRLVPLARSQGTVEQNVAPVLVGEHVFMVDQVDAERAHIVHAKLSWQ